MRALVAELPDPLRRLRLATLTSTLAGGVPVDPLALTVVLSALDETCDDPLVVARHHVEQLLWIGIERFCHDAELAVPTTCAQALHAVLAQAVADDVLSPGSDSAGELFGPLREMGFAQRA